MKSTTFALASLLASVAMAQPHKHQHQHLAKRQQKRAEEVVWVTDYDYVTETVGVTTTIWVTEGYEPPTSAAAAASTSTTPKSSTLATSTSQSPAQFFQPETKPAAPSSTSTSVYVAPTPSPVDVPPTTPAAPVPTTTSITPVNVAPAVVVEPSSPAPVPQVYTQAAAVPAPPQETPTSAAAPPPPAPTVASSSGSSSGGTCSSGSPCAGDITFYEAGLGACGTTNDGSTERVVALPHGLMGTQSNGNPYCGKTVTIKCTSTGKTTTATVVDKCMGCVGYSIDLSNAAFQELDSFDVGRTGATWWFN